MKRSAIVADADVTDFPGRTCVERWHGASGPASSHAGPPRAFLDAALAGRSGEAAALAEIAEVLGERWPKCEGETPSAPHHWRAAGFDGGAVERWLEVGVYSASAAAELQHVGVPQRRLISEWSDGITWGRAFCDGLVTMEEIDR